MGADAEHSLLSPSKRHRWGVCPGSIRLEAPIPEPPTKPVMYDGTRTHTLLEQTIKRRYYGEPGIIDPELRVGEVVTDEYGTYTIDIERARRVNVAMAFIHGRVDGHRPIAEQRVHPDGLVGRADLHGTVDIQIPHKKLYVISDYKDGAGYVEVEFNPQLEQYALGVLAELAEENRPEAFELVVIQPRNEAFGRPAISSWIITTKELLERVPVIIAQAAATDAPDAPLVPGEAQCKYCRAKATCPALTGMVSSMFGPATSIVPAGQPDLATSAANKDPEQMSGEELRRFLDAAPLVEGLLKAIKAEAKARAEKGIPVPGYKLVRGKGSRAWALPEEEMVKKLTGMGIPKSAVYVQDIVSPAQAEKLSWDKGEEKKSLSKIQIERLNKEYVTNKAGAPILVPESDQRPAIVTDASSLFGSITVEATVVSSIPSFLAPPATPVVDSRPPWLR